jgi:hypothetical protein
MLRQRIQRRKADHCGLQASSVLWKFSTNRNAALLASCEQGDAACQKMPAQGTMSSNDPAPVLELVDRWGTPDVKTLGKFAC